MQGRPGNPNSTGVCTTYCVQASQWLFFGPPPPLSLRRRVLSLGVFATLGVPLALVESLPYMMVGMFSPHDKHGQLLGKLNVWIGEVSFCLAIRFCSATCLEE